MTNVPSRLKAQLALKSTVLFVAVYFSTNSLAAHSARSITLSFDWDRSFPLIPAFIYPYLSIFFVIFIPLFLLENGQLHRLSWQINSSIVASGLIFLLCPTQVPFERVLQQQGLMLNLLWYLDLPHNAFPSLHVSLSFLCYEALREKLSTPWRWILALWIIMVLLSVLFTHQHTTIDIVGGLTLACLVQKLLPASEPSAISGPQAPQINP